MHTRKTKMSKIYNVLKHPSHNAFGDYATSGSDQYQPREPTNKRSSLWSSSSLCERLRPVLQSLCCESTVITLTLLSVLAITGEILIDYGILTAPTDTGGKQTTTTAGGGSQSLPSSDTSTTDERKALEVVQDVFHYLSLTIAALFFVEMIVKVAAFRRKFFMHPWQVVDLIVVCTSLAVEIAFEVNGRLPELEVVTFVIICRLWRIPHACNIRAQNVQRDLEQEIEVWKAGASKMQDRCNSLDSKNIKQKDKIERLERELAALKKEVKEGKSKVKTQGETDSVPNGTVPQDRGSNNTLTSHHHQAAPTGRLKDKAPPPPKPARGHIRALSADDHTLDGSPGKKGSKGEDERDTEEDTVEEDEAEEEEEENRRNYFRSGSESSLSCHAVEQEVHVQIEDEAPMASQKEGGNSDVTPPVQRREKLEDKKAWSAESPAGTAVYYNNEGFMPDAEGEDFPGEILHEIDGARTYRSADGIPMTDL